MTSATTLEKRVSFVTPSGEGEKSKVVTVTEVPGEGGPTYQGPVNIETTVQFALRVRDENPQASADNVISAFENFPEAPEAVMRLIRA